MSNNIWDFYSHWSNQDAPSHSRPSSTSAQASYQLYYQPLLGNHHTHISCIHESAILPREINASTSRHLNILHYTVLSTRGLISQPSQVHQPSDFGVRRPFLRMPQHVVVMPASADQPTRLTTSFTGAMAGPAMPPGSDVQAASREMNNTVVVTQTLLAPQIYGRDEEESASDGTQPYINLLDHPIQTDDESAESENLPDGNDDGSEYLQTDLTLKL